MYSSLLQVVFMAIIYNLKITYSECTKVYNIKNDKNHLKIHLKD